jgi:hypothetical protein
MKNNSFVIFCLNFPPAIFFLQICYLPTCLFILPCNIKHGVLCLSLYHVVHLSNGGKRRIVCCLFMKTNSFVLALLSDVCWGRHVWLLHTNLWQSKFDLVTGFTLPTWLLKAKALWSNWYDPYLISSLLCLRLGQMSPEAKFFCVWIISPWLIGCVCVSLSLFVCLCVSRRIRADT